MKSQYVQNNPKIKFYRDYKSFNFESINNEVNKLPKSEKYINYSLFQNIFLHVLNAHESVKKKVQKFNKKLFMTKQLRKAIMNHSRINNVFNKSHRHKTCGSYDKQCNFCVNF